MNPSGERSAVAAWSIVVMFACFCCAAVWWREILRNCRLSSVLLLGCGR